MCLIWSYGYISMRTLSLKLLQLTSRETTFTEMNSLPCVWIPSQGGLFLQNLLPSSSKLFPLKVASLRREANILRSECSPLEVYPFISKVFFVKSDPFFTNYRQNTRTWQMYTENNEDPKQTVWKCRLVQVFVVSIYLMLTFSPHQSQ